MLAVLMLHFGELEVTAQAVTSAVENLPEDALLLLLDNASGTSGAGGGELRSVCPPQVRIVESPSNLGFAAGMNRLIAEALSDPRVDKVLLLNNDTVAQPGCFSRLCAGLEPSTRTDMAAARLVSRMDDASVDSLGITLYRSGLASNRKRPDERLLGPTGGCMLLSRRLIEDVQTVHGTCFDESFFCYAEDTDLVMRARWLGYQCAYVHTAVLVHHGSKASGGPGSDFVLYHGIRNSIWALAKNAPGAWLLLHAPWIFVAHSAILLRHLRRGRGLVLRRLYVDALKGLPGARRFHRQIAHSRRVPARTWWQWVEPSLYERTYLRNALRDLFRR